MIDALPVDGLIGPMLIRGKIFSDERGYFTENWSARNYAKIGIAQSFVQDNVSLSSCGVLRGLHYQIGNRWQGKLISVFAGAIFDVIVDLRSKSPTFGKWFGQILEAPQGPILWVPPGFAHGFLSLKDNSIVAYKCTEPYNAMNERILCWNDPDVGVVWPLSKNGVPILSQKDAMSGVGLYEANVYK